jgi:hypothetical protein
MPCSSSRIGRVLPVAAALTLALAACGDKSTPISPPTSGSYQVTGTVAYGHSVAGQTVVAVDGKGGTCAIATTAADGTYTMDTTGCAPGSVALSVENYATPGGVALMSIAAPPSGKPVIDGVVNIDPLTTLLAYDAAGMVSTSVPPAGSSDVIAMLPRISAAQISQATTNLLTVPLLNDLQSRYGVATSGFSPISTPFSADGQGLDAFFDAYALTAPSSSSVQLASAASGLSITVSLPSTTGNQSVVSSSVSYAVGGSVSGLSGGSVTLLLNGANALAVSNNGTFTFPARVSSSYAVTVSSQPAGETCTVANGTGAGITSDVAGITVTCSIDTYSIGGAISGLMNGTQVVLSNNGADPTTVTANGSFSFSTPVAYDSNYSVTVSTQPTGQVCTVSGASGANVTAEVTNVTVVCSALSYSIGGTVTGLASGTAVTLDDNGGDPLVINANGSFTFATPVAFDGSYNVTVGTQPSGQNCAVSGGAGSNISADVGTVQIACVSSLHVYVTNLWTELDACSIGPGGDLSTCAKTPVTGGPTYPSGIAFNGNTAYVADFSSGAVDFCPVNADGSLASCTAYSGFSANWQPWALTVATAGNGNTYLYATDENSLYGNVQQCLLAADGSISSCAQTASGIVFASGIAISGSYAYLGALSGSTYVVEVCNYNSDGSISGCASTGSGFNHPSFLTIDNGYVYVVNEAANTVSVCTVGANGALSSCPTSALPAGTYDANSVVFNGSQAYVDDNNGNLWLCSVDGTTGALTGCAQGKGSNSFSTSQQLAIH